MTRPTQQNVASAALAALGGFFGTVATMFALSTNFGDRMWVPREVFEERMRGVEMQLASIKQAVCQNHPCFQPVYGARR